MTDRLTDSVGCGHYYSAAVDDDEAGCILCRFRSSRFHSTTATVALISGGRSWEIPKIFHYFPDVLR